MLINLYLTTAAALVLTFTVFLSPAHAAEILKKVENEKVCMVTDMHFGKKQIPVTHEGKTYYGCCANCKATLSNDAKARMAVDPVSGKSVDKATAFIVAREDSSVLYFENEKTFKQYTKQRSSKPAANPSQNQDHSGH